MTSSNVGQPPTRPPIPVHTHAVGGPAAPVGPRGRPVVGAVLMILGVALCAISVLLPWNYGREYTVTDAGVIAHEDQAWNAFDIVALTLNEHGPEGVLLPIALILALLSAVATIALAAAALAGSARLPGALVLTPATVGMAATLGTLIGYFALGFSHQMDVGVWLFGLSFVPVLIGAIGVVSKKY